MAGEAQLRVAIDEDVPWNCFVFKRHFIEQATGVGEEVAFGVQVEEADVKGCRCREYAGFEEMGVYTFSISDVFQVGEAAELGEEVARLRRQADDLVHKLPAAGTALKLFMKIFFFGL